MNNGFFGFPTANSEGTSKLTQFDSSGAYMILPGTKRLYIFAVGAGGGGGGGARAPSGTGSGGGSGGGGGGMVYAQYNVEDLGGIGVSLIINIGAGGIGGIAAMTNSSPGLISSGSGSTQIYISGKPGILINALAGLPGNPGTNGAGGAATVSTSFVRYNFPPITGAVGVSTAGGTVIPISITVLTLFNHGGCGGGGVTTGSAGIRGGFILTPTNAVLGIISSKFLRETRAGTLYDGGQINTATPPVNSSDQINGVFSPGVGAPGGGGGASVSANAGGNGYRGSGGGGGGAALNDIAAGSGGNGGNGYVAIFAVI